MGRYYKAKVRLPVRVTPRDVGIFGFCAVKWNFWRKTRNLSPSLLRLKVEELLARSDLSSLEKRDLGTFQRLVASQEKVVKTGEGISERSRVALSVDPVAKFFFALGTTCAALALVALL
jgi:hypothetical protein